MKKKKVIKTNAVRMVEQAKIPYVIHEYDVDTAHLDALHAADGMGIPVEEVYKTIVLTGDRTGHLVACIAAHKELDLKQVAKISGNKRVELLSLDQLEPLTGYVRGGCSPIGMKKKFPTFIEESAMHHKTIRISAGKRGLQMELAPKDLQKMTEATLFNNASHEEIDE
ncbi:Cys-tRNA(Pro) deacylase [Granulicatella adiacens ATCC 49175]|uniref:Cys-tRNA(Pro)/Cys-tRNA(Cys) deacylase n=1 Tax=Granulicatella adiacens ATCC 49175 TaxID=638301 RepID=C8NG38_9LACT|nr:MULTISPECIES: Cys-tRNA(Pro) deacylase [Granulicatella]RKW27006.1 MAG: Cys-tRNA(Pro) deacylase [Granulicatella sp.]EEW37524.1 YbaK/EbsC protein [Granulicatella adiacens ATCC 49175]UAK93281.1 Cys-tRNA(Pro) deacylase [Granulicatella adiacens]UWP37725.1 Cys-tRNA(Pro) deacylase [Granulicatella adiacens ATCC 49175]UXY41030.1 Cys-tRNA(Pro) deacylase [Granulicatella adiacens]